MNILLNIKNFLEDLYKTFETILKILILSRFRLNNSIKIDSEKAVVLANGPSLNTFLPDYEKLKGFDVLTVNFFTNSNYFFLIKPKYHIIIAPELWIDDVDSGYYDLRNELFDFLSENVSWEMNLIIPFGAKKYPFWLKKLECNKKLKIVYINTTPVEGIKFFRHLLYKINLGMPRPHNVVVPSLMTLINFGYKQIYLLGVDHSWLNEITVTETNDVLVCQKHFYDEAEAVSEPMRKLGRGKRKLHEVLHKFYLSFKGYFEIEDYAVKRGTKIYNSTHESYIDAFERKTLNTDIYA